MMAMFDADMLAMLARREMAGARVVMLRATLLCYVMLRCYAVILVAATRCRNIDDYALPMMATLIMILLRRYIIYRLMTNRRQTN